MHVLVGLVVDDDELVAVAVHEVDAAVGERRTFGGLAVGGVADTNGTSRHQLPSSIARRTLGESRQARHIAITSGRSLGDRALLADVVGDLLEVVRRRGG